MNLNKKELKIISYNFNCMANRLLRVSYIEIYSVLKMFIGYIENTSIINDYVRACTRKDFDVTQEVQEVSSSYGRAIFDLGNTIEEEIYTVYTILKYISETEGDIVGIARSYSDARAYQDMVKDFNNRVTLVLINHIEAYLTRIGIEMGYDEDVKYMITVNGQQVNIAKDQSTINAIQNNGTNSDGLIKLVDSIKELLDDNVPKDEKEMIEENIETIQEELKKDIPKKGLIKTCIMGLKVAITNIPTAIELSNNVEKFIEFVKTKIPQ
ncbi:hypothetical protein [Crassaminicella indica]|uniref:Uncharacterized protein n=1 Tax=Crassaminicella indica TaxID=2855394 RepID=A0ABX8RD19_9CLOT|nr:hypothetical protein [Crassaminicella indica]QXM06960.1 hypothetical protein KVH43_04370 [Crassaminicella indica]